MADLEQERACEPVQKTDDAEPKTENDGSEQEKKKKKKKKQIKRRSSRFPRFGCLKMRFPKEGGIDMEVEFPGERRLPTHLVIMVNGIIGSAHDWRYAAKQFLMRYPEDVIVHCSERNSATATFDGVDVTGERLAEEVISVIKRHPDVQKVSFVGHSLGGLIARYAIARLYERDPTSELSQANGSCGNCHLGDGCKEEKFKAKIAGLEPMNFITLATPHLGSRWHKQVPIFCGLYTLEKVAKQASWCLGRTGRHLFLTDKQNGNRPLLLQMVSDHEDLKFMSALKCFKRRVVYANSRNDSLVGWSTSSLRHKNELPKHVRHLPRVDKYPHIINLGLEKPAAEEESHSVGSDPVNSLTMEEEMLGALTKMSWERYDINFGRSKQRFLAHNAIQVTSYSWNSDGADVIQHMVDTFLL